MRHCRRGDAETPPAKLQFKFNGTRVEVTGENTGAYHGARAYFDGEYLKTSDGVEFSPEEEQ